MIVIDTPAELAAMTEPALRPILDRFVDMMDLATIFIIGPGDTLASIEQVRGMPFDYWEFIEQHPIGLFEIVWILDDEGTGHVVLVPDQPCIDPDLLALCRAKPGDMIEF